MRNPICFIFSTCYSIACICNNNLIVAIETLGVFVCYCSMLTTDVFWCRISSALDSYTVAIFTVLVLVLIV
jgi:hypothetical protein